MPEPKGGRQCDRLPGRERSVKTERAVRTTEKGASGQSKTVIEKKNPVRKLILLYIS